MRAYVKTVSRLARHSYTNAVGRNGVRIPTLAIGTHALVEVRPQSLRLEVYGPFQFLGRPFEVSGPEESPSQGVMFPGRGRFGAPLWSRGNLFWLLLRGLNSPFLIEHGVR